MGRAELLSERPKSQICLKTGLKSEKIKKIWFKKWKKIENGQKSDFRQKRPQKVKSFQIRPLVIIIVMGYILRTASDKRDMSFAVLVLVRERRTGVVHHFFRERNGERHFQKSKNGERERLAKKRTTSQPCLSDIFIS